MPSTGGSWRVWAERAPLRLTVWLKGAATRSSKPQCGVNRYSMLAVGRWLEPTSAFMPASWPLEGLECTLE